MVKVTIATMVKNEDDIIRHWIEYHGKIFGYDSLYILDNFSTDNTFEICKEYLNRGIHLLQEHDYNMKGVYMTHYKNHTDCDIFIPLDIDEFVCYYHKNTGSVNRWDIMNYLEGLLHSNNGVFKMNYILPINVTGGNGLEKFTHGTIGDWGHMAKTFVVKRFTDSNFQFDHGNHVPTNNYVLSDLMLVHFHQRSHEQFVKKVYANVVGLGYQWDLNTLKNQPRGSGWHHVEHAISLLENPSIDKGPALYSTIQYEWIYIGALLFLP
jgi:hypothetical protein